MPPESRATFDSAVFANRVRNSANSASLIRSDVQPDSNNTHRQNRWSVCVVGHSSWPDHRTPSACQPEIFIVIFPLASNACHSRQYHVESVGSTTHSRHHDGGCVISWSVETWGGLPSHEIEKPRPSSAKETETAAPHAGHPAARI